MNSKLENYSQEIYSSDFRCQMKCSMCPPPRFQEQLAGELVDWQSHFAALQPWTGYTPLWSWSLDRRVLLVDLSEKLSPSVLSKTKNPTDLNRASGMAICNVTSTRNEANVAKTCHKGTASRCSHNGPAHHPASRWFGTIYDVGRAVEWHESVTCAGMSQMSLCHQKRKLWL